MCGNRICEGGTKIKAPSLFFYTKGDTVTTPTKLHTWYPERFHSASCPFCGAPWADVHHLAWVCKKIPGLTPLEEPKKEEWEAGLRSEEADKQKLLVGRAGVVIDAIGALD
ncbi:hypothetical protein HPB47_002523 [Ixodes persulcatus]|uniref:Uncharacterized protein n=1 Tax=Ixodes persulcatus TaxID=34615 RepID=A0AC60PKV8_IXOPE|nr:hypothetical protein HPB47_002523 [Ixodes persulcatus]